MAYFNAAATEIQRHFRGFYSRRYKHSYYARAAYIAAVLHNTERLRAQLQGRPLCRMRISLSVRYKRCLYFAALDVF